MLDFCAQLLLNNFAFSKLSCLFYKRFLIQNKMLVLNFCNITQQCLLWFIFYYLIFLKKNTSEVQDRTQSKTNQRRVTLATPINNKVTEHIWKNPVICIIFCLCIYEYINFWVTQQYIHDLIQIVLIVPF